MKIIATSLVALTHCAAFSPAVVTTQDLAGTCTAPGAAKLDKCNMWGGCEICGGYVKQDTVAGFFCRGGDGTSLGDSNGLAKNAVRSGASEFDNGLSEAECKAGGNKWLPYQCTDTAAFWTSQHWVDPGTCESSVSPFWVDGGHSGGCCGVSE